MKLEVLLLTPCALKDTLCNLNLALVACDPSSIEAVSAMIHEFSVSELVSKVGPKSSS